MVAGACRSYTRIAQELLGTSAVVSRCVVYGTLRDRRSSDRCVSFAACCDRPHIPLEHGCAHINRAFCAIIDSRCCDVGEGISHFSLQHQTGDEELETCLPKVASMASLDCFTRLVPAN